MSKIYVKRFQLIKLVVGIFFIYFLKEVVRLVC